jgi:hypothetical protein
MSRWYERANEASFKSVEGGYVFQNPNPWVLARPSYYLVDEAKKAAILNYLGRWRLMMVLVSAAMPLSMMLVFNAWPKSVGRLLLPAFVALGPALFSLLLFAALLLLIAAVIAIPQFYLARSLRPVLADAPRTEERIKVAEQLPKIAKSASSTVLIIGLVGVLAMMASSGIGLIDAYFEGHLARSAFASAPLIVVSLLLGSYFVYLLRLKAKMRRAPRES